MTQHTVRNKIENFTTKHNAMYICLHIRPFYVVVLFQGLTNSETV